MNFGDRILIFSLLSLPLYPSSLLSFQYFYAKMKAIHGRSVSTGPKTQGFLKTVFRKKVSGGLEIMLSPSRIQWRLVTIQFVECKCEWGREVASASCTERNPT